MAHANERTTCLSTSYALEVMAQEFELDDFEEYAEVFQEFEAYEDKPRPNLEESQPINLGTEEEVREMKINTHVDSNVYEDLAQALH